MRDSSEVGLTPVERVAVLYGRWETGRTFREDLEAHLVTGYVISTPEYFIMGRAVDRSAAVELVGDPWHAFPREAVNTWYVWAMAGCVNTCLTSMPFSLKWVSFIRRGGPPRYYDTQKLLRRAGAPGESGPVFLRGAQDPLGT